MQQEVNNYTQNNLTQQRQNFASFQQANATLQAGFDSYNKAWWDRNNASYQANRNRTANCESSADRISRLQSEAIRGVNTYTREDGSEVEVSVDYDRAFENNLGDVYATNSQTFNPSNDWYEMNKKK